MSEEERVDVTRLLQALGREGRAEEELYQHLYAELHRVARSYLGRKSHGHTLQATTLVSEAYLRLVRQTGTEWANRQHFLAVAARAMRSVLVDHARHRQRLKRGGDRERIALEGVAVAMPEGIDLLELEDCLAQLEERDPPTARLAELRFFGGLSVKEAGDQLGIPERSARRKWQLAKVWLQRELSQG